ncbi:MAG TPA: diguanylate cyclase [Acidobacteriaceae bacterium]|nr:diguanylate cyclase [Acidobacteriaceae bacterium]
MEDLTARLESWQFHVETADRGAVALLRLSEPDPPAIALLDMDLPVPGGMEIAWELGRRPEGRQSWLVLMSNRPNPERIRAALACGCDDFLALPPSPSDLELRLRVAQRARGMIAQVQNQTAELRYQMTHDALTGLWNREALLRMIFQETDRVQRMKTDLCLMLLDLDEFSRVNHDYGYEAGDQVLSGLANRFRRQLRSYDLIGRCGEDEFLLALPGCRREDAAALGERIRATILARPFAVGSSATTLTASFGIAPSRGRSPLVVLREAERALAEAKLSGKNCVRCFGSQDLRAPDGFLPPGAALIAG